MLPYSYEYRLKKKLNSGYKKAEAQRFGFLWNNFYLKRQGSGQYHSHFRAGHGLTRQEPALIVPGHQAVLDQH